MAKEKWYVSSICVIHRPPTSLSFPYDESLKSLAQLRLFVLTCFPRLQCHWLHTHATVRYDALSFLCPANCQFLLELGIDSGLIPLVQPWVVMCFFTRRLILCLSLHKASSHWGLQNNDLPPAFLPCLLARIIHLPDASFPLLPMWLPSEVPIGKARQGLASFASHTTVQNNAWFPTIL